MYRQHYTIDMQTGVRSAKLMPRAERPGAPLPSEEKKSQADLITAAIAKSREGKRPDKTAKKQRDSIANLNDDGKHIDRRSAEEKLAAFAS